MVARHFSISSLVIQIQWEDATYPGLKPPSHHGGKLTLVHVDDAISLRVVDLGVCKLCMPEKKGCGMGPTHPKN